MRFEKWQGLGNNYIVVETAHWPLELNSARAAALCDRNFGVGSDGILEVTHEAAPRMTVWNPDGSHAENCGNGIRMVARYLAQTDRLPEDGVIVTGGGPVRVAVLADRRVRVEMGRATFPAGERWEELALEPASVAFAEISMGNPHAVIEHPNPEAVTTELGPMIEADARFPDRTNVEFVRAEGASTLTMRVWERGVGETLACGTGACAAAVAAVRLRGLTPPVTVQLLGGDLEIDVADDLAVTMTGPAEAIYAGEFSPQLIRRLETL